LKKVGKRRKAKRNQKKTQKKSCNKLFLPSREVYFSFKIAKKLGYFSFSQNTIQKKKKKKKKMETESD
jgi:hypothetical protein